MTVTVVLLMTVTALMTRKTLTVGVHTLTPPLPHPCDSCDDSFTITKPILLPGSPDWKKSETTVVVNMMMSRMRRGMHQFDPLRHFGPFSPTL